MKNNEIILWYEIASYLALFADKITRFGYKEKEKEIIFKDLFDLIGNNTNNNKLWDNFANWRSNKKFFYTKLENLLSGIEKTAIAGDKSDFITVFGKNIDKSKKEDLKNTLNDIKAKQINEYQYIKNRLYLLSRDIISDDRFNGSDVSLWEQSFFVSSYFKSKLFEYLQSNKEVDLNNIDLDLKWKILAIQYDKLGLAEKSYNLSHIKWYRDTTQKIDNELKTYFEYELAIGNELYRDETGIYFIFPNIKLINNIKDKILDIFKNYAYNEFYPYIALSNLTLSIKELANLIKNAKSHFLKIDYSKKDLDLDTTDKIGICQICNIRFGNKKEEYIICKECFKNKENNRLEKWNIEDETIWLNEIRDKNSSIALISLQFGLDDWLNGKNIKSLLATNNELRMLNNDNFINQHKEKIEDLFNLDNLNDLDKNTKKEYAFSYLSTKNPAPSRLKRVWDTTKNFFDELYKEIDAIFDEIDKNRIAFDIGKFNKGIYKSENFLFVYKNEKLYLISPLREFLNYYKIENLDINHLKEKCKKFKLKNEDGDKNFDIDIKDIELVKFKPYISIIDTTPISWQFVIPASYITKIIDLVQKKYIEEFKYVNGKLPLHIGVITQNYKFPLYIGIKALRSMKEKGFIENEIDVKFFKEKIYLKNFANRNDIKIKYFGTFWNEEESKGKKIFYEKDKFFYINNINDFSNEKLFYYPNTIDFEYLDTNTRRNEIYYKKGNRDIKLKQNRPYSWEEFEKFEEFKKQFKDKSNQLQALISLIYSKMEDWDCDNLSNEIEKEDCKKSFSYLMKSTFKRVQKKENIDFSKLGFELDNENWKFNFNEAKKFLDMFEFWHTTLKEI